jgi:hypothetical protein
MNMLDRRICNFTAPRVDGGFWDAPLSDVFRSFEPNLARFETAALPTATSEVRRANISAGAQTVVSAALLALVVDCLDW